MKNLKKSKDRKAQIKSFVIQVVIYACLTGVLIFGISYINKVYRKQNLQLIKQSVQRTAVECYSIEGFYPAEVDYLEENYNLSYNHDKYFVFYDTFASNMMPLIEVYEKK